MCVSFIVMLCACRFGLDWAHDKFIFACHMFMHCHAYVPSILYILIYLLFGIFLIVSFFFSLSFSLMLVVLWHQNVNLFRPRTFFVPGHLLVLWWEGQIGLLGELFMTRHSFGTPSHSVRFLWHWPTHCHPVRVGSHFVVFRSRALSWSYRSSTPICKDLITLYLSFLLVFGVYAL